MSVRDICYIAGNNSFNPITPSGVGIANKFVIPESLNLTNKLVCTNPAFYLWCVEYMASIDAVFYGGNDMLCMLRKGHATDCFALAGFTAATYITAMKYVDLGVNGRVLLVGSSDGKLMSTTDGINWTNRTALLLPAGLAWGSSPVNTISYNATNGYYLIGGNNIDPNQTRLVKVIPGDPWTSTNLSDDFMTALTFQNDIMSLDFDPVNGIFLIGTSDGDLVLYRHATGFFEVSANYTADVILIVRYSSVLGKFAIGCQNSLLYTYAYDTLTDISAGLTTLGFIATDEVWTIRDLPSESRIIIGGGYSLQPRIGKFDGASEWTKYGTYLRGFDGDHSVVKDIAVKTAAEIEDDPEGALQYRIILLDKTNVRKEIITNKVEKFEWSYDQWGGCGRFECVAKEELDSTSELWNITEGWQVQLWILGYQNTWELRYTGYINKISTYLDESGTGLEFEGDGFSGHLNRIYCNKHFTATTVAVALKYILDTYVLPYSPITYDNNQIQGAATVTDIYFRGTALDAIKILALLQGNTDWGVDANKKFYFKTTSSTVGKVLIQQKDIDILNISQDFEHIYNVVTVLRGFTDSVFNIGAEESSNYSHGGSITSYDRRERVSLFGSLLSATDSLAVATNLTTVAKDIWKTKQLEAKPVEIIDWIEFIQPIGLVRIFSPGMLTAEDEEVESVRYTLKGDAIIMAMQLGKPESEAVGGMSVLESKVNDIFDMLRQIRNSSAFKIQSSLPYLDLVNSSDYGGRVFTDATAIYLCSNCYYDGANWQRKDISKIASLLKLKSDTNELLYYSTSAGANPIASWDLLNGVSVYHAQNTDIGTNQNFNISKTTPTLTKTNAGGYTSEDKYTEGRVETKTVTVYKPGQAGQALVLNGSTQYIKCGNVLNLGYLQKFSWSVWFKTGSNVNSLQCIINKQNSNAPYTGYGPTIYNGKVYWDFVQTVGGAKYLQIISSASLSPNTVYQLVVTKDDTNTQAGMKLYLNGVEGHTNGNNQPLDADPTTTYELCFGCWGTGAGRFAGVTLDEAVCWTNYVLTQTDVDAEYGAGAGKHHVAGTNIAGIWHFNNDVLDSSGNGYNGTAVGNPTYTTGTVPIPGSYEATEFDRIEDGVAGAEQGIRTIGHASGSLKLLTGTKTTPVDADSVYQKDSADSNKTKISTWTQTKAFLKTYFDTVYILLTKIVTSWSSPTLDTNIPSEKLVKDNLGLKANDADVVHDTGNENVDGIKIFSSSPIVPTPTTDYQASTKKYVDDNAPAVVYEELIAVGGTNESFTLSNLYTLGANMLWVIQQGQDITTEITEVDTTHFTIPFTVAGEKIITRIVTVLSHASG
ncbi:MAG: LamG-like jellyroll fold domain-containing protein, partial [Planctomycetota bacterium]